MLQPATDLQQSPANGAPDKAIPAVNEPHPPSKYAAAFTDFKGLHRDVLPFYSERSLRELVRQGVVPSIRLPRSRKRLFDVRAVEAALRRHQSGGTQ